MGEARRRKSVAAGTVHVVANGHHRFSFTMTRAGAISVQERFFQLMKVKGYDAENCADKVPGFWRRGASAGRRSLSWPYVRWGVQHCCRFGHAEVSDPLPGHAAAGPGREANSRRLRRQELGVMLEGDLDAFKRYAELEAKGIPCEKTELRLTTVAVESDGKPAAQPVPLH